MFRGEAYIKAKNQLIILLIILFSVISASAFLHYKTPENQENITHQTSAVNTKIEQSTGIVSKVDVGAVSRNYLGTGITMKQS